MGAISLADVVRVPGRLCYGPTSLAAAYPHGGTALGPVHYCAVSRVVRRDVVRARELGGRIVEGSEGAEDLILTARFRGLDDDALALLWPSTATGASTHKTVRIPGSTNLPGTKLTARAQKVLFSPLDVTTGNAWGAIFYRALPLLEDNLELQLNVINELDFIAAFQCIPDASGRVAEFGRMADLVAVLT